MELFSGLRRLLSRRTRTGSRGLSIETEKVFQGQPPQDAEKLYRRDFLEDYSDTETAQFSFFTSKLDSVIHASSINSLALIYRPLHALLESGEHDGIWWLDVTDPSDGDIELLSRLFDIHPLTTEDIRIRETREKIEIFGPYYFLSLRPPQQAEDVPGSRTSGCNVYAIVFREGVLSFTFGTSPHTSHVRSRIKDHQSHLFLTSDWISYALIDDIVDGFAPLINRVEASVETMEDGVSITRPDDIGLALKQIYTSRRQVLQIRQLLNDKTDVIRCFARHCDALGSTSEVVSYLIDIQDHVLTMVSNLAHSEQRLSRSQDKYLSQLSFDSSRMRNQIVASLSRLTVIASCIVPMQVITGLFGMNVMVPGKHSKGLGWWLGIFGVILALIVLSLAIARRSRFL
ncbi:putative metal ion transporter C27B12.12c [Aspergillus udagawae]|uniref:Metal ion transporter C27B12.12c n=1 Tax=Aspergillus udagawae TaxID=91492 RepID=A0ABQ1AN67_9EURO|nr:putative metal ion transporter C27B12.12c [Aspergillus udagawae]GFF84948.1 putative metal ion transporter C27B12.12c [Aspergillus udagawae]GFG03375.1 putative metal ion transporter C27B12.12c [Aspergillus udagawae]